MRCATINCPKNKIQLFSGAFGWKLKMSHQPNVPRPPSARPIQRPWTCMGKEAFWSWYKNNPNTMRIPITQCINHPKIWFLVIFMDNLERSINRLIRWASFNFSPVIISTRWLNKVITNVLTIPAKLIRK